MGYRLSAFYLGFAILALAACVVLWFMASITPLFKTQAFLAFLASSLFLLDSIVWWAARREKASPSNLAWVQRLRVASAVMIMCAAFAMMWRGFEAPLYGLICLGYFAWASLYAWYFFYVQRHESLLLGDLVRAWKLEKQKAEVATEYSLILALVAIQQLGMAVTVSIYGIEKGVSEAIVIVLFFVFIAIYLIVSPFIPLLRYAHRTVGANCFLSYATEDHALVEKIREGLEARHIGCFHDKRHVLSGDELAAVIGRGIATSDAFLVVLSASSVASSWVRDETFLALHYERLYGAPVVIPVRVCSMEIIEAWKVAGDDVGAKLRARSIASLGLENENWGESMDQLAKMLTTKTQAAI